MCENGVTERSPAAPQPRTSGRRTLLTLPPAPVQVEHLLRISDVELHLITDKLTYKLRCGADAPEGTMQRWFDELVIPPPPLAPLLLSPRALRAPCDASTAGPS